MVKDTSRSKKEGVCTPKTNHSGGGSTQCTITSYPTLSKTHGQVETPYLSINKNLPDIQFANPNLSTHQIPASDSPLLLVYRLRQNPTLIQKIMHQSFERALHIRLFLPRQDGRIKFYFTLRAYNLPTSILGALLD